MIYSQITINLLALRSNSIALGIACALIFSGCVSHPSFQDAIATNHLLTNSKNRSHSAGLIGGMDVSKVDSQLLSEIQSIELAYSRGDCKEIAGRVENLINLIMDEHPTKFPLSVLVAISTCTAQLDESDSEQLMRARILVDESLAKLTPTWDRIRLLESKAAILTRQGRFQEALIARQDLAKFLKQQEQKKLENDFAMVRLHSDFRLLNRNEQEQISDINRLASNEGKLFEAVNQIQRLKMETRLSDSPFHSTLQRTEEAIMQRAEELFSRENGRLANILEKGDFELAKATAEILKRQFPMANFHRRIVSTLNIFSNLAGNDDSEFHLAISPNALETTNLSPELRKNLAKKAINEGNPEQAVKLLRAIPIDHRNPSDISLLAEADANHVRDLRFRVKEIFMSANNSSDSSEKVEKLLQAVDLLNFISTEYPKSSVRKQIERNILSIRAELQNLRKTR